MDRYLGRDGFGPAALPTQRAAFEQAWRKAEAVHERVGGAIGLAKLGDMTVRDGLLDLLVDGIDDEGLTVDALHLLVCIADEETVLDERFVRLASTVEDLPLYVVAASGRELRARAAVPIYLGLAQVFEQGARDYFEAAVESVRTITDVELDELDDDPSVEAWGARAMAVVTASSARYLDEGEPFTPAPTAKRLTGAAMHSERSKQPFLGAAHGERLATWSGILCPIDDDRVLGESDVRALVDYALTLSRLPWRPGAKYFYGHDVDGGPGLHDAPTA